jgi:uncharacterized OB-fold protein
MMASKSDIDMIGGLVATAMVDELKEALAEQRIELAALRAENERLHDELESLRAQLYGTQCEDCAGQGMPQKAVLYCCHCGQPFTRVVEGKG